MEISYKTKLYAIAADSLLLGAAAGCATGLPSFAIGGVITGLAFTLGGSAVDWGMREKPSLKTFITSMALATGAASVGTGIAYGSKMLIKHNNLENGADFLNAEKRLSNEMPDKKIQPTP